MKRLACLFALASMGCAVGGCVGSASNDDMNASSDGGSDGSADGDNDLAGGGAGDLANADLLPSPTPWVYVSGNSSTISRFRLDLATGALTAVGTTTSVGQTSFLAIDTARRHLFAVDEQNSKVEAFTIDATTGALTHVGTDRGSGGSGPAHLSVDATGKWVLTANYSSGDVAVLAVATDGTLAAPTALAPAPGVMAHQILLDVSNAFAWVPCLGSNHITQLTFNAATGALATNMPVNVNTAGGGGPRHLALHPNGKFAFLIEETASMMSNYSVDAAGNLTVLGQRISTRANPMSATGNTGAEVQVHPSGKFLYGSNRGDNDIVLYTIGSDGSITYVANKSTGGQTPRHFSIDATGKWLLVGNQASNDVRVFAIAANGTLTETGTPKTVTAPTFVGIVTF